MEIRNTPYIPSAGNLQNAPRKAADAGVADSRSLTQRDTAVFSDEALRFSETASNSEAPRIRFDLVNRIKSEIAAGTYDTPEKMDVAVERMASRLF